MSQNREVSVLNLPTSGSLIVQRNSARSEELMAALESSLQEDGNYPWAPLWASAIVAFALVGIAYRLGPNLQVTPAQEQAIAPAVVETVHVEQTLPSKQVKNTVVETKPTENKVVDKIVPESKHVAVTDFWSLRSRLISESGRNGGPRYHVKTLHNGLEITLLADWFFSAGDDRIQSKGSEFIQSLVKLGPLAKGLSRWEIGTYTDSGPIVKNADRFSDNQKLSDARAQAVAKEFTALGIPDASIHAVGFGDSQAKPELGKNNRRVVIQLLGAQ